MSLTLDIYDKTSYLTGDSYLIMSRFDITNVITARRPENSRPGTALAKRLAIHAYSFELTETVNFCNMSRWTGQRLLHKIIKYINTSHLCLCDKISSRSEDFDSSKIEHFNN